MLIDSEKLKLKILEMKNFEKPLIETIGFIKAFSLWLDILFNPTKAARDIVFLTQLQILTYISSLEKESNEKINLQYEGGIQEVEKN